MPVIISLASVATMIGTVVANHYRSVISQNSKIHELDTKFHEIKTKFDIFWVVIEKELPKILIRPTHREMDELLVKVSERRASEEEVERLKKMMREELENGLGKEDAGRAFAYVVLMARLESDKAVNPPGVS